MRVPIKISLGRTQITAMALLSLSAAVLAAGQALAPDVRNRMSAQELAQQVVWNELNSQRDDQTYWMYREIDRNNGTSKVFEAVQTPEGSARILLAVNGEPIPSAQRQKQDAQLEKLLKNPASARKADKARHKDGQQERKLLAMLPQAFLFNYAGDEGNLVRLDFVPNPQFHPPTLQAQVFHHMQGHLLVDPRQERLVEMDGRLVSPVKFYWGLLGHLNQGGTFQVRQIDLGSGHWEMSRLRVNMHGKALFFESIGVQEDQSFEDYRENNPGVTLAEAVAKLELATFPCKLASKAK